MVRVTKKLWMIVLALAALAAVLSPATEAAGKRLVVDMEQPFEVLGQRYESGQLELREVRTYSPVATLNEIRVNGRSVGIFFGLEGSTVEATRDELIFARSSDGVLVLESVAFSGERTRQIQTIGQPPVADPADVLMSRH